MTLEQKTYNKIIVWVDSCENEFHLQCADVLIELFGKKFPEGGGMKGLLIDLLNDKWQELKNQKHDK